MQIAGPAKWGEYAPHALGLHQSPVVISSADAVYEKQLQDSALKFHYTDMEACSIINTGRSVQIISPTAQCCMCRPRNYRTVYHKTSRIMHTFFTKITVWKQGAHYTQVYYFAFS